MKKLFLLIVLSLSLISCGVVSATGSVVGGTISAVGSITGAVLNLSRLTPYEC